MLFASDLDNTLIHSCKRALPSDVCVEVKDGRALSFITQEARRMLRKVRDVCRFVPVTTRSLEQYRRLSLMEGSEPDFALVCNGAILLRNGEVDAEWLRESRETLKECAAHLESYAGFLSRFSPDVRVVDGFFIFAGFKGGDAEPLDLAVSETDRVIDKKLFELQVAYRKIYIMPKALNKGIAVSRLIGGRKGDSKDLLVCAGDSLLDLPMLAIADISLVPSNYPVKRDHFVFADSDNSANFSEYVLEYVLTKATAQTNITNQKNQ
jgi:hydroxymethylpyrimidine pyrophosphatase-like HAD family hydrolase